MIDGESRGREGLPVLARRLLLPAGDLVRKGPAETQHIGLPRSVVGLGTVDRLGQAAGPLLAEPLIGETLRIECDQPRRQHVHVVRRRRPLAVQVVEEERGAGPAPEQQAPRSLIATATTLDLPPLDMRSSSPTVDP